MIKLRSTRLFLMAATLLAATCAAFADPLEKALLGKWDSTSYTVVQQGKPGESVQMKPGTMVFTYRDDGTWQMEAADEGHTQRDLCAPGRRTHLDEARRLHLPGLQRRTQERWQRDRTARQTLHPHRHQIRNHQIILKRLCHTNH